MNIVKKGNLRKLKLFNCLCPEVDGHAYVFVDQNYFCIIKFGGFGGLCHYTKLGPVCIKAEEDTLAWVREWIAKTNYNTTRYGSHCVVDLDHGLDVERKIWGDAFDVLREIPLWWYALTPGVSNETA